MVNRAEPWLSDVAQVAGSPPARSPARFTRAGLIAVRGDAELVRWRALDELPTTIWSAPTGTIAGVEASPDGAWLAILVATHVAGVPLAERRSDLWCLDVVTGDAHRLVAGALLYGPLVWSPASDRIALCEVGPTELAAGGGVRAAVVGRSGGDLTPLPDTPIDADPYAWNRDGLLLVEHHPLGKFKRWFYHWAGGATPPCHVADDAAAWTSPDGAIVVADQRDGVVARHADRVVRLDVAPRHRFIWLPDRAPWLGSGRMYLGGAVYDLATGHATEVSMSWPSLLTASADGHLLVFERDERLFWAALREPTNVVRLDAPRRDRDRGGPLPEARVMATTPRRRSRITHSLPSLALPLDELATLAAAWLIAAARLLVGDDDPEVAALDDAVARWRGAPAAVAPALPERCVALLPAADLAFAAIRAAADPSLDEIGRRASAARFVTELARALEALAIDHAALRALPDAMVRLLTGRTRRPTSPPV